MDTLLTVRGGAIPAFVDSNVCYWLRAQVPTTHQLTPVKGLGFAEKARPMTYEYSIKPCARCGMVTCRSYMMLNPF